MCVRWRQNVKSTSDHVSELTFLFSCPQIPSINLWIFYCMKQIHFSMCVYCMQRYIDVYRSQKTSQRVKNNSHATRLCFVSYFLFFTRCDIICNLSQYNTRKNVIFLLNNKCRNPNGCVCRYLPINRVHARSD